MGLINLQDAANITNINALAVSAITNVNGLAASAIGLGGGGGPDVRFFALGGPFRSPGAACGYGGGGDVYYFDLNEFWSLGDLTGVHMYIDDTLTTPMNGANLWWYSIDSDSGLPIFLELQIATYGVILDNQDVC